MPFNQLITQSSCQFVTVSMNSLVDTTCNQTFPYLYALSILVILIACFSFLLMILTYYMTVRLQYFEYIEGDLDRYYEDESEGKSSKVIMIEMEDKTNRRHLIS